MAATCSEMPSTLIRPPLRKLWFYPLGDPIFGSSVLRGLAGFGSAGEEALDWTVTEQFRVLLSGRDSIPSEITSEFFVIACPALFGGHICRRLDDVVIDLRLATPDPNPNFVCNSLTASSSWFDIALDRLGLGQNNWSNRRDDPHLLQNPHLLLFFIPIDDDKEIDACLSPIIQFLRLLCLPDSLSKQSQRLPALHFMFCTITAISGTFLIDAENNTLRADLLRQLDEATKAIFTRQYVIGTFSRHVSKKGDAGVYFIGWSECDVQADGKITLPKSTEVAFLKADPQALVSAWCRTIHAGSTADSEEIKKRGKPKTMKCMVL